MVTRIANGSWISSIKSSAGNSCLTPSRPWISWKGSICSQECACRALRGCGNLCLCGEADQRVSESSPLDLPVDFSGRRDGTSRKSRGSTYSRSARALSFSSKCTVSPSTSSTELALHFEQFSQAFQRVRITAPDRVGSISNTLARVQISALLLLSKTLCEAGIPVCCVFAESTELLPKFKSVLPVLHSGSRSAEELLEVQTIEEADYNFIMPGCTEKLMAVLVDGSKTPSGPGRGTRADAP